MPTTTQRAQPGRPDTTSIEASTPRECPACSGTVREDTIETVCEGCGLILDEDALDHGPDWYTTTSDDAKHTGAPRTQTRHDHGLATTIGHTVDASGRPLDATTKRQFRRLRRHHRQSWFDSTQDRNLAHGLGEVRRLTSTLALGESLREQACQLFRTAQTQDLLVGRSIEAIAAGAVYATCRCNQRPTLLADIAQAARVDGPTLQHAYNVLNRELELPIPPRPPSAFVARLATALDVDDTVRRQARALAEALEDRPETVGNHPAGVAAGCLYVASDEHPAGAGVTQAAVAAAADVSTPTVRATTTTLEGTDVTLDDEAPRPADDSV